MREERILWERYLEASKALEEARTAERAAWGAVCECRRGIFSELGEKRLQSMRDFGARYFDEKGNVK